MAYQVLARKYRPQNFADVLGQEHVTKTLQNAIESGRLHHAYLFTGVRGVGKTTVARILAKALNCEKAPTTEPCNLCKNCADITTGINMDVQEIDGASNTGVDDVREIRERIKYLPSQSKYKIYVIDEVHMLSTAAFNALLKTLEEPPAHVIFVFATTEPQKIPATILSRCQRYDFRRVAVPVIAESIRKVATAENISIEPDAVTAIALEAEGSMRDAQSLFDQAVAFSGSEVTYEKLKDMLGFMDRSQLKEIVSAVAEKNVTRALKVVDEIFNQGGNMSRLCEEMLGIFRNILIFKATSDQAFLRDVPSEEKDFVTNVAAKLDVTEWEQLFKICYRDAETIARTKFPKMLFEVMIVQMSSVQKVESVDELLERVDAMAKGLPKTSISHPEAKPKDPVSSGDSSSASSGLRMTAEMNPADRKTIDSEKWKEFVTWLHAEKAQLSSFVEHGIFVSGGNGKIVLQFSDGSMYYDHLNEAGKKRLLESYIKQFFSTAYALDLKILDGGTSSGDLRRAKYAADKDRIRTLKEETLSNQVVKDTVSILGADIKEIKIKEV